jgi:uncharacterized protein YfaS (alpha-2-macroglobulin family)
LKTGEPIKDVEVSVWVKERLVGRESDKLVASSVTDANGLAQLPLSGMSGETGGCFFVASKRSNAKILPIAWVALSEYELRDLVTSGKSLFGTIYTDRPVYRPGNKVHFKGIVREQTPNGYRPVKLTSRPSSRASHPESFDLFIRDPDGNIVHRTQVALNDFGSFSGSFTLNDEAPTGTYTVEAVPQGNGEGSKVTGSFVVAAYRKPEVQVTVKPERRRFSRSEKVTVTVSAQYYFGMPVAGARVLYIVSRLPVVDEQEALSGVRATAAKLSLKARRRPILLGKRSSVSDQAICLPKRLLSLNSATKSMLASAPLAISLLRVQRISSSRRAIGN